MIKKLTALLAVILLCFGSIAQENEEIGFGEEFEDIFDMEVTVASKNAISKNETPGVVTVLTYEEIQNLGARDLIDVLNLVPGFDFGIDVTSAIGAGMRGLWAYEGKLLIMIDGQEMQEQAFATYPFGNRVSVDQIQKIEIIRGPGSSLYGGNAELGVINIVTRRATHLSGIEVSGQYGQMERAAGRQNINLNFAKNINSWELDMKAFYGQGIYSEQVFSDIYGTEYDLKNDGASTQSSNFNVGLKNKGFDFRLLYENYNQEIVSIFDAVSDKPYKQSFSGLYSGISYAWDLNEKLTFTPRINYKSQKPWNTSDEVVNYYNATITRVLGNLQFEYNPNDKFNLIFGGEYYQDKAKHPDQDNEWYNGEQELKITNTSAFLQGIYMTDFTNITVGMRYDSHSKVDAAFSPRISFTKEFDKFHYKLLYSRAFRTPSVANLVAYNVFEDGSFEDISPNIKPEKSDVIELEIGYRFNTNFSLNGNIFHTTINDPMVYYYYYDENTDIEHEGYYNDSKYGSKGFELEARWKDSWGYIIANYAYYSAKDINEVDYYAVPSNQKALLAFPQNKFNIKAHLKINSQLSINPSLIVKGKRYGYATLDVDEEEAVISEFNPLYLCNLYLRYQKAFDLPLEFGVGVYDIFSQKYTYIQPYNGWHAPFPGPSREFTFKVKYHFNI